MSAAAAEALRQVGVRRVIGLPLPGLHAVVVTDPVLALVLADADGRRGRLGAVTRADGGVTLSAGPGRWADVADPADAGAVSAAARSLLPPAPSAAAPLDPARAGGRLGVVAGPWVVRLGGVDGLRDLAAATGASVVNTWGAKGVFAWDDPFHAGTAGLQARDFELAGLGDADLVVTTGLEPAEATSTPWQRAGADVEVVDVPVAHLGHVALGWPPVPPPADRPALYSRLAEVVGPMYEARGVPLAAPRAARDLAVVLAASDRRGFVAASTDLAGFWVARAFPTSAPGSVLVPSQPAPGLATAAALLAALDGEAAVVVTEGLSELDEAILELARSLDVTLAVEVWGPEGSLDAPPAHAEGLRARLAGGGVTLAAVPVAVDDVDAVVDVAGDIVAW